MLKDTLTDATKLKQYIERIENLENEKKEISGAIKDVYDDAKGNGFDPKIMKQIVKIKKMNQHEVEEQEMLLDVYKRALGIGESE